jgi:hypothetical protein
VDEITTLPRPAWAMEIIRRLDDLPTILKLKEHVGTLTAHVKMLLEDRSLIKAELAKAQKDLTEARQQIQILEQTIINHLKQ